MGTMLNAVAAAQYNITKDVFLPQLSQMAQDASLMLRQFWMFQLHSHGNLTQVTLHLGGVASDSVELCWILMECGQWHLLDGYPFNPNLLAADRA